VAIKYKPKKGQVLICNFQEAKSKRNSQAIQRPGGRVGGQKQDLRGFVPPEMIKRRPVIVLSNRSNDLCVVVPLSTTKPYKILTWHHRVSGLNLPHPYDDDVSWAKCDHIHTVCYERLSGLNYGNRQYKNIFLDDTDFHAVYKCVLEVIKL
jgi:uncharacterized protein YifN (PemK superfamily)